LKEFSESVYRAASKVPAGRVTTYGSIARAIGKPKASHAVGQALKANPHPPEVVPCHRVIGEDGKLHGYRWGKERKQQLLRLEQQTNK